jgi:hypothetical protein
MTIKEFKALKRGRWDGRMKRRVVIEWRLGLLTLQDIVETFFKHPKTYCVVFNTFIYKRAKVTQYKLKNKSP